MAKKKLIKASSFVVKGQKLLAESKQKEAIEAVTKGLEHYGTRILQSINPYATPDAGLVVIALRHVADSIEKDNPGTKEFVEALMPSLIVPELKYTERIEKPTVR